MTSATVAFSVARTGSGGAAPAERVDCVRKNFIPAGASLLEIPRDLAPGREPDIRLRLDVRDEIVEVANPRSHPDKMRVEREEEHRAFPVRGVEVVAERLEYQLGRWQRRRSESRRAQRGLI